jgi:nucleotide-binding universal stress UspA family protein
MLPFKKILYPVDYSPFCEVIVPYIKDMVHRFSAKLALVHAYGTEALAYSRLPITDPGTPEKVHAREGRRLRDFARANFPGQHVESFAELGEAGTVIDKILKYTGVDLIMLPTHGRGPIRRFLLGSVVAKVLHDASAAVWTGTDSTLWEHAPQVPYRSILCCVDNSDETESLITVAAAVAGAYQARLSLVQVVVTPPAVSSEALVVVPHPEAVAAAEYRLRELTGQLGIDAPYTVMEGLVPFGVRVEAMRVKADLIITGRRSNQTWHGRLWSNLYEIVREAPCPVLSI